MKSQIILILLLADFKIYYWEYITKNQKLTILKGGAKMAPPIVKNTVLN